MANIKIGKVNIDLMHYSGKDIYKADVAVVMTNQFFTKQAMQDARNLKVELWDRDKIYELQMAGMKKSEKEK